MANTFKFRSLQVKSATIVGGPLTLTGGTVTASAPLIDASQTWNASGTTFTGVRFNITNTASAAASIPFDFQIGGTSQFRVRRGGGIECGSTSLGVRISDFTIQGLGGGMNIQSGSGSTGFNLDSGTITTLGANTNFVHDGVLFEQRRSTSPVTFRLYSTFTSTTNFERLNLIAQTSGSFIIGTEKGSAGGTARALEFQTDGVTRFTIGAAGVIGLGSSSSSSGLGSAGLYVNTVAGQASIGGIFASVQATNQRVEIYGDNAAGSTFVLLLSCGKDLVRFGGTTSSFPALKRSSTTLQVRLADDSAFAPFECAGLTLNGNLTASTRNIVTDTTTGTKIGTATTQKIGFFNATPVVQPTAVADATDAATVITQLNALLSRMRDLGLIAT